jgi:hypothetical protein
MLEDSLLLPHLDEVRQELSGHAAAISEQLKDRLAAHGVSASSAGHLLGPVACEQITEAVLDLLAGGAIEVSPS